MIAGELLAMDAPVRSRFAAKYYKEVLRAAQPQRRTFAVEQFHANTENFRVTVTPV